MADDTTVPAEPASLAQRVKQKLTIPRSAMPYFIAALLAAMAMGWYFFLFVPQKLEYFVGLRFRTLAVAGGQIKSKAENLGRALSSAPSTREELAAGSVAIPVNVPVPNDDLDYLRLLVPDIQLDPAGQGARPQGLHLTVDRSKAKKEPLTGTVQWSDVASQGALASVRDFDDLLLADNQGRVVWQREKTTPRLGNLKELLYAPDDTGSWLTPSWAIRTVFPNVDLQKGLPATATLKPVRVGVGSNVLLVQALNLDSPHITEPAQMVLYVAGVVSRNRLQQQAMQMPLAWLVVVSLPVVLLFLALPFVKLATLREKERFSFANLVLLALGTVAAAGLAAAIPAGPRSVSLAGDEILSDFATEIESRLAAETRDVLKLADEIMRVEESKLQLCAVKLKMWKTDQLCHLWAALDKPDVDTYFPKVPELDVAIWIDDSGNQLRKWTTKTQVTGRTTHRLFQHFRDLTSGRLWTVDGIEQPFTIDPLRAPTTAELGVVFARRLDAAVTPTKAGEATPAVPAPAVPRYFGLNVRPQSVVDALVPPGYGFAILSTEGRVLFHSDEGLSLEENFLEEVSDVGRVRDRMQLGRPVTWSGDYHGAPHRLHIRPVHSLQGSEWRIVTFQELGPALAAVVEHQSGVLRLVMLNLTMLLVAALLAWWYTKSRGRDIRDLITASFVLDTRWLWGLVLLALLALTALAATTLEGGYQRADALYLFFVLLPFAAILICVLARRFGTPAPAAGADRGLVGAELALLVLLVGAVPAAGFARIVQNVQSAQAAARWLEIAHQRTLTHAERSRARATSLVNVPGFRPVTESRSIGPSRPGAMHSYLSVAAGRPLTGRAAGCDSPIGSGQPFVRGVLRWTLFSPERYGDADVMACAGTDELQLRSRGVALATLVSPAPSADAPWVSADWERWTLALAILAATIGAAYWANRRLVTPRVRGAATFKHVVAAIASDGNQGILLIGPPRTKKDQAVQIHRSGEWPMLRIKLLDQTIDEPFIAKQLASVRLRQTLPGRLDAHRRLWIHLSNLETQLVDEKHRTAVLQLLEKLLDREGDEPSRIVVVTTSVDPIAHFREIFTEERGGIYNDDIPEVALSRTSLLLSRFRRCYIPIETQPGDPWWDYAPLSWRATLAWEAAKYPPLVEVARALEQTLSDPQHPDGPVERADLATAFRSKALACYDLLWASCTRCEKLVLVQLAQEGFVTTVNQEVVSGLINKGLIVERPNPTIFNNTFRSYLRHIEHDQTVAKWEREDGNGLWLVAGRLIGSSLIVGGLFYLVTQDFSVDSLLPVVSGTGIFGVPVVRALLARVTARGAAAAMGA